jgi:hypothetical protein
LPLPVGDFELSVIAVSVTVEAGWKPVSGCMRI